jgi:hypothetical protein
MNIRKTTNDKASIQKYGIEPQTWISEDFGSSENLHNADPRETDTVKKAKNAPIKYRTHLWNFIILHFEGAGYTGKINSFCIYY